MSDYLTDEEQLARLKSWWDENGRWLLAAIVLGITGVVGWRWYETSRNEEIATASDLYADYMAAEGDAQDALAETISTQIPDTAYAALVLMREAAEQAQAEDWEAAEGSLKEALAAAPEATLGDLIRIRLARVLVQRDLSDEALEVLGAVRGEGYRPVVAELKGDILVARGERAAAHEAYQSALENLEDGTQKPLLELKAADTADAAGS